jgi:hypothetical protein
VITGQQKPEVKYSYMIQDGDLVQVEETVAAAVTGKQPTAVLGTEKAGASNTQTVSTGKQNAATQIIDVIVYTDNPALDGKQVVTTSATPPSS